MARIKDSWLVFCRVLDIFVNHERVVCSYLHERTLDHIIKLWAEHSIAEILDTEASRDREETSFNWLESVAGPRWREVEHYSQYTGLPLGEAVIALINKGLSHTEARHRGTK